MDVCQPCLVGWGMHNVTYIQLATPPYILDPILAPVLHTRKRQQPLTGGPAHLPSPAHPGPSRNFRPVLPGPSLPPIIRGMHISFRELDPRTTNTNTSTPELISFISLVDPHSSTKYPISQEDAYPSERLRCWIAREHGKHHAGH